MTEPILYQICKPISVLCALYGWSIIHTCTRSCVHMHISFVYSTCLSCVFCVYTVHIMYIVFFCTVCLFKSCTVCLRYILSIQLCIVIQLSIQLHSTLYGVLTQDFHSPHVIWFWFDIPLYCTFLLDAGAFYWPEVNFWSVFGYTNLYLSNIIWTF